VARTLFPTWSFQGFALLTKFTHCVRNGRSPPRAISRPDASFTQTNLGLAVHACTGILAPPAFRTPGQNGRLKKILDTLLIPGNFLLTDMGYATFAMSDLVHDPRKLSGKIGTGNAGVDYGDPEINASIGRVSPNPGAANRLGKNYTPTGLVPVRGIFH